MQLMGMNDEEVVCAFSFKRAHKTFAQSIGSRRFGWRLDGFDAGVLEQALEFATELAIVVMNEIFWPFSPRGLLEFAGHSTH